MKRKIVELSIRGESPNDIALEVGTTLPYVYNARAEARKRGITFPPITINNQIEPEPAGEVAQAPP